MPHLMPAFRSGNVKTQKLPQISQLSNCCMTPKRLTKSCRPLAKIRCSLFTRPQDPHHATPGPRPRHCITPTQHPWLLHIRTKIPYPPPTTRPSNPHCTCPVRPCPDTTGRADTCNSQISPQIHPPRRWVISSGCWSQHD